MTHKWKKKCRNQFNSRLNTAKWVLISRNPTVNANRLSLCYSQRYVQNYSNSYSRCKQEVLYCKENKKVIESVQLHPARAPPLRETIAWLPLEASSHAWGQTLWKLGHKKPMPRLHLQTRPNKNSCGGRGGRRAKKANENVLL